MQWGMAICRPLLDIVQPYCSVGLVLRLILQAKTYIKMSEYANPFIELAPVLDATPQIKSYMITKK